MSENLKKQALLLAELKEAIEVLKNLEFGIACTNPNDFIPEKYSSLSHIIKDLIVKPIDVDIQIERLNFIYS